ncbi:MAG: pyridoxal phosphate-dependent aminotransferase [Bacteroidales bacterium]|nr:pyridoxal phosphate-dependent aminotransferase [Bacteroidales bacterium]
MMERPIAKNVIDGVLAKMDISDISRATIRQCVAVANKLEELENMRFIHLEIGVPGILACPAGIEAQKKALDSNIAHEYPPIGGIPVLKQNASRFLKAFADVDIDPECIVPTVGSMQASMNLILECSQLDPKKDTILYINPGFAPNMLQAKVQGIKTEAFDIYDYRAEKLRGKLEEYMSKGNIAAVLYSNPNNPAWICLSEDELKTIGELATKYDVVVLEDLAYFCMDFRQDLSKPGVPPFQPTVSKYTDNYVIMMSSSKIFSYAGERIGVACFSPKLFYREYPALRKRYGIGRMGDNFILTYLYVASSGVSHSVQYAYAALLGGAAEGKIDFISEMAKYGQRAHRSKEIFERHGFHIVYDKDLERKVGDGFFYTMGYGNMSCSELMFDLVRCGITAITLNTTGSSQNGIRACVSRLSSDEDFIQLDKRLGMFEDIQKEKTA